MGRRQKAPKSGPKAKRPPIPGYKFATCHDCGAQAFVNRFGHWEEVRSEATRKQRLARWLGFSKHPEVRYRFRCVPPSLGRCPTSAPSATSVWPGTTPQVIEVTKTASPPSATVSPPRSVTVSAWPKPETTPSPHERLRQRQARVKEAWQDWDADVARVWKEIPEHKRPVDTAWKPRSSEPSGWIRQVGATRHVLE
jgi:hypothetical protein